MRAIDILRLGGLKDVPGSARIVFAPKLDLVVGVPAMQWWEGLAIGAGLPSVPAFSTSGYGTYDGTSWSHTPVAGDVGTARLHFLAADGDVSTLVTTRPAIAAGSPAIKILCIGDSFTGAAVPVCWIEYVDVLLVAAGVAVTWLGTQQSVGQSAHVYHEGYPGRSYAWWIGEYQDAFGDSPFLFADVDLDPARYATEQLAGQTPDLVICILGANGYTTMDLNDPAACPDLIRQAGVLFDAMQVAWPSAWIAVSLAIPCRGEHAQNDLHRQRRHRFAEQMLVALKARIKAGQRIAVLPEIGCIDPANFPTGNDHFNAAGAEDLGRSMYGLVRRFVGVAS